MGKSINSLGQKIGEGSTAKGERLETSKGRGFFNAVANRLASARLGDLLVDSGLITRDQLEDALVRQKGSKAQLGQILIEIGAITPISLYRKLAEQWCIKTSAAGLTMMISMSSLAPRSAAAESFSQASVTLASATTTTHYKLDNFSYPALFGFHETRSNDISGFSNWTGMMNRFEAELKTASSHTKVQQWKADLAKLQNKSFREKVRGVNRLMNAKPYISDNKNWKKSDYWATPVEFLNRGGDCEDFAIAKYASLRALGVPAEQMRLAVVLDKKLGIHHAILIVYDENGAYVLDNQDKAVKTLASVKRYKPIFSINQQSWWLHKRA